MKPIPKNLTRLIKRVAELRVAGSSWVHVARHLKREVRQVRSLPRKHPELWETAYATAEKESDTECGAEALLIVRQMLRGKDEKIKRDAAQLLIRWRIESRKLERRAQMKATDVPPSTALLVAAEVEKYDDAQLEIFISEQLAAIQSERVRDAVSSPPSSGSTS